jgi:hypothetical protein
MKVKQMLVMIFTLIISIVVGTLAGNAYLSYQNNKMESGYLAGCAIHANDFCMEARYKKSENGMPLAYFTFIRYERACDIVAYMNYVIDSDKFWEEGGYYGASPEDQIEAKQKLYELFGAEITMEDVLKRSHDAQTLLNTLPENIIVEIINDGGTDRENR